MAGRFEGFGLTPMEGIASGVPVVASDLPAHREHLGDAVTYFPPDADAGLAAAIQRALERGPVTPHLMAPLSIEAAGARFRTRLERMVRET